MRRILCILTLFVMVSCRQTEPAAPTAPINSFSAEPFILYVSPDGSDEADGSADAPLQTLVRALEILLAEQPNESIVRVYNNRGVFEDHPRIDWTYYNTNYTTTIEAWPTGAYTRFHSNKDHREAFFILYADNGEPTRIVLRGLMWTNYVQRVILFYGDREDPLGCKWNGYNEIDNCVVRDHGEYWDPEGVITHSSGPIGIANSRYNTIRNCTFQNIANANNLYPYPPPPNLPIVIVYLAHYSKKNNIYGNTFYMIRGDCVRIRDACDGTVIHHNEFIVAGWTAAVTMWYCIPEVEGDCGKIWPECPSYECIMFGNIMSGKYPTWDPNWHPHPPSYCSENAILFCDMRPQNANGCTVPIGAERMTLRDNYILPCPHGTGSKDRPKKEQGGE